MNFDQITAVAYSARLNVW